MSERWEKVHQVERMMREIEDKYPTEDRWTRFPGNIDLEALVQDMSIQKIRNHLVLIDEKVKYKYIDGSSGERYGRPETRLKNYHLFIKYAPEILEITELMETKGLYGSSSFDRPSETIEWFTEKLGNGKYSFEDLEKFSRKSVLAGGKPSSFFAVVENILQHYQAAVDTEYEERKLAELEASHKRELARIQGYSQSEEQQEALQRENEEFKAKQARIKARAAFYRKVREEQDLAQFDFERIAKLILTLYRQYKAGEVNEAFGSWDAKAVYDAEFGCKVPLFLKVELSELVRKMERSAKLDVSPNTYADISVEFLEKPRVFGFNTRWSFDIDFFKFSTNLKEVRKDINSYLKIMMAGKGERGTMPQTLGYSITKQLIFRAAELEVSPDDLEFLMRQYRDRRYYGDEEKENREPSRMELLQLQNAATPMLEILEPLFCFDKQSRDRQIEKQMSYILDEDRRRTLEEKGLGTILELGSALLMHGLSLSVFLDNAYYGGLFQKDDSILLKLVEELADKVYDSWDRENLIKEYLPKSSVIIEEIGLEAFLRVLRFCAERKIDLPLFLSQILPVMEDAIVAELRAGRDTTPKKRFQKVLGVLKSLEQGEVSEETRAALIAELKNAIGREAEREVEKINTCLEAAEIFRGKVLEAGLDYDTVYGYLRKEKFQSVGQFFKRGKELIGELTFLPEFIAQRSYRPFSDYSQVEKERFEKRALAKREELAEIIGEDNLHELGAEISSDYRGPNFFSASSDNPTHYNQVIGGLISWIPLPDAEYQLIKKNSKQYGAGKDLAEGMFSLRVSEPSIIGLATEMRKRQIAKGLRVAEIGGTVASGVMKALGAESIYIDAGRDDHEVGLGFMVASLGGSLGDKASRTLGIVEPENLVTLENYQEKIPGEYDFSISNQVFDAGSGVGAISEGSGDYNENGAKELLAVFANITCAGGYSFHGGATMSLDEKFLEYLGFKLVFRKGWSLHDNLTIFRKEESNPDLFPYGVRIGSKVIRFSEDSQKFFVER